MSSQSANVIKPILHRSDISFPLPRVLFVTLAALELCVSQVCLRPMIMPGLVAHIFHLNTWEAKAGCASEASLVCMVSSRLASAT